MSAWLLDCNKRIFTIIHGPMSSLGSITLSQYLEMTHPEDRGVLPKAIENLLRNDDIKCDVSFRMMKPDGEWKWCHCYLKANKKENNNITITGTCKDITKDIEKANLLYNLNKQNEIILNNTRSALLYLDTNFVIQWSNVEKVCGSIGGNEYKSGSKCFQGFGLKTNCKDCPAIKALESGEVSNIERSYLDDPRVFNKIAVPIKNGDQIEGIVIRVDDVTEFKNLYNDLKEAKEKAEVSDKLKSAFLANMSHEIRTPLNAIVGFSDLIINTEDKEERDTYGKIINNNSEQLINLIDDILDLSKIESGFIDFNEQLFDINQLLDDLYSTFSLRLREGTTLHCIKPSEDISVLLDIKRVSQIYQNFLSNSIKYTKKGSIMFGYTIEKEGIKLYVKDTGIGISEEDKSKVFKRFHKFNNFAQGTGLGLSICKAIVDKKAGAEIGFESEYEKGSLFYVYLPCIIHNN